MAADTTTLTEKMRAALRISSTSEKITVANEKAHEKVVEAQRSIWESETGE